MLDFSEKKSRKSKVKPEIRPSEVRADAIRYPPYPAGREQIRRPARRPIVATLSPSRIGLLGRSVQWEDLLASGGPGGGYQIGALATPGA